MNLIDAEKELARLNQLVEKLTNRDLRNGTGPSVEFKKTYKEACRAWRVWSNALDVSEGRTPAFDDVNVMDK